MLISVIIPTYNRERTIERSMRSVLNQTYRDIELIIVDDGSTDNTASVVRSIEDPRIRYISLDKNSGANTARNTGIDQAKGDYIAFQDSDDEWVPDKLERQLAAIKDNNADVCFCNKKRITVNENSHDVLKRDLSDGIIPYQQLHRKARVSTQTILAKRKVFDDIRFDPSVTKAMDYEWSLRAGQKYIFCLVSDPMVIQYLQEDSITIKGRDHKEDVRMCEYFLEKFRPDYEKYPDLEISLLIRLAHNKSLGNMNAGKEYLRLYKLTGRKKYLIMKVLADTGILSAVKKKKYSHYENMLKNK